MPPAPVCNPAFRAAFAPLVDPIAAGGAAGPGQTVVDNTRTVANGETLDSNTFVRGTGRLRLVPGATVRGNIYVLGQGVLEVAGDAVTPAVVGANIYLFDDAVMQVTGQLNLDQQFSGELLTIGLDRSAVNYTNASVQQGRFNNLLYSHVLCGSGGGTVSNSTWMRGNRGTVVFFVRDSVHYVINGAQATLFELTAGESSRFTLSNTTGSVGAYFELGNTVVAQPATLRPNPSLTATVSLTDANGRGPVYEFNATDVFFGLWHGSGVDVTLVDSALPLFSRMDEDVTVTGLAPGMFGANGQVTAPFPDRSIKLLRTEVYLWNAYMERPVTVRFQQSRLGELACSSQAHCVMEDCQLDGTGGFITVKEDATLDVLGGQMTSLLTAQGNALVRLTGVAVSPELDGSDTRLQANGNATIFLQNTVPQGAVTPTVYDNGALVFALIDQPAENALLGSMVTVTGAATSLGVATAPGAFQSWTLQLENSAGAMVQQIASGSTPVDFTVFATFTPTPGLPSGNYAVALRVDTVGGVNIALARRNVRL